LDVGAGVIDSDFTGNVGVLIFNFGMSDYIIKQGDRMAQLIIEKICYPRIQEVQNIRKTDRNEQCFGFSG